MSILSDPSRCCNAPLLPLSAPERGLGGEVHPGVAAVGSEDLPGDSSSSTRGAGPRLADGWRGSRAISRVLPPETTMPMGSGRHPCRTVSPSTSRICAFEPNAGPTALPVSSRFAACQYVVVRLRYAVVRRGCSKGGRLDDGVLRPDARH